MCTQSAVRLLRVFGAFRPSEMRCISVVASDGWRCAVRGSFS